MAGTHFSSGVSVLSNPINGDTNNRKKGATTDFIRRSQVARIRYSDGISETQTGIKLPPAAIVREVYLNVITPEATGLTKTVDVGPLSTETGGDANGYLAGVDVSTAGVKKGTLLNTGQTLGALLAVDESGTGGLVPEPHVNLNGNNISWTPGSNDFAELVADVIVVYDEVVS